MTNQWGCSAKVNTDKPVTVRLRSTYDGGPFGRWRSVPIDAGSSWIELHYTLGTSLPLPGGSWACTFVVGNAHVTIPFQTNGPTGDVVDFAICSGHETVGALVYGICRKDESASGIPKTDVVICDVVITHRVGSFPKIEFLNRHGAVMGLTKTGISIKYKLWPFYAWKALRGPFKPGQYTCRVSLDGEVVATRPFTVGQ